MSFVPGVSSLQIAKISAALPAAGAWDTPRELFCSGAEHAALTFSYTRGGAAGAFDFQIFVSPYADAANVPAGAQEWASMALYDPAAVVAGADSTSNMQRELITYTATGAAVEAFVYGPLLLGGTIERIRIRTRESGNVGAPGTLAVTMTLSGGE